MAGEDAAGFWSYAHEDDQGDDLRITRLATRLKACYGLITARDLELFVDRESLVWGDAWRERIDAAIAGTTFFIPIITPRYFESAECRRELLKFTSEAAVDRLAQRISDIAQSVSRVPDQVVVVPGAPATERSQDASDSDEQSGASVESEGVIEALAEGEEALPRLNEALEAMNAETESIGALATEATKEIEESDRKGRGFAGRLAVTRRLASHLEGPAERMQQLGQAYTKELMTVNPTVKTFLDAAEADSEVAREMRDYLRSLEQLSGSSHVMLETTADFMRSLDQNAKLSRSLQPPNRLIKAGLQGLVDGGAIVGEWGDRARAIRDTLDEDGPEAKPSEG